LSGGEWSTIRYVLMPVRLPTDCSRGYYAGNINLKSGILYGDMALLLDCFVK